MPNVSTIICEVVTSDGDACWRGVGEVRYQSTPAHTFDEWQPGAIPVDIAHQTAPIGWVDYLECRPDSYNGALMAVAVVDASAELVDGLMSSPEIRCDALHTVETVSYRLDRRRASYGTLTATRSILDSVGIVAATAGVTSTRINAFDGDYRDPVDWSMMKARRQVSPLLERAKAATSWNVRSVRPQKLKIHRPRETPAPVEYRKASTLAVSSYLERIIDLIAVPYNEPTEVLHRGRWIVETVAPGAFAGVHGDVTVNRAHDLEQPLGRVLSLHPEDPRGLRAELRISRTASGNDVLELAADGLLGASVGFAPLPGGEQWAPDQRSRKITKAMLAHIALTGDPAYKGAKVLAVRGVS